MSEVVLVPDHYYNCPICGQTCHVEKESSHSTGFRVQGPCQEFLCYNPLASDPLHYYSHVVRKSAPNRIAYQEFSLDLGNKYILFSNDYVRQITQIKDSHDRDPLDFNFVIVPDFPHLVHLKKKVRTAIVFS